MYGVEARNLDGSPFVEGSNASFELVMHGVIWHYLPHLRGVAQDIVKRFAQGECFVSMECWFENYDYGFFNQDGELIDVITRNDNTAHLEPHLKVNGGSGEFNGNRIARALLGITFGGVGIVKVPANRRSDVLNMFLFEAQAVQEKLEHLVTEKTIESQLINNVVKFKEDYMNDLTPASAAKVEVDVRGLAKEGFKEALQDHVRTEQAEKVQADLSTANQSVAKLEGELKTSEDKLAELGAAVDEAYETAKAGATSSTPEEIARIDRAIQVKGDGAGDAVWTAKLAWMTATASNVDESKVSELEDANASLREENEKLTAKLRGFERTDEISELLSDYVTAEELEGLVKTGLSQSDETYEAWLEEKKLFAGKMFGKEKGDEEKMNGKEKGKEKKAKSRVMTPAEESEEQKDYGVVLRSEFGKKPGSVPATQSLAKLDELSEHFEEVEEDANLDGAEAGDEEEKRGNPYSGVIAELFAPKREKRSRGVTNEGGN
jgi:hypothetical protein